MLFLIIFPLAVELQHKWDKNGLGFKHWFQDEQALTLIKRGMNMAQQQRAEGAVSVLITAFRSGVWASTWRVIRRRRSRPRPHSNCTPTRTSVRRRRGRPRKTKSRAGRPRKTAQSPNPSQNPMSPAPTVTQRANLRKLAFMSPPPFVPKLAGRRAKSESPSDPMLWVHGVRHTLIHSRNIKGVRADGSIGRLWKQDSGRGCKLDVVGTFNISWVHMLRYLGYIRRG